MKKIRYPDLKSDTWFIFFLRPEAVYRNFHGGRILPYDRLHGGIRKDFIHPHEFNDVIEVQERTYGELPEENQFVPFPKPNTPCILLGPETIYQKIGSGMYGAKLIDPQSAGFKDFPPETKVIDLGSLFKPDLITRIALEGTFIYTDS